MSEKDKAALSGWLVGVLTTIALAIAAWSLQRTVALGEEVAVQKTQSTTNDRDHSEIKDELREIRQALKLLVQR